MHVMFVPSWYSSPNNPVHGSFFKEQALALQDKGLKISIGYNEILPITTLFKNKEEKGLIFKIEEGLKTYRYRNYNFIPKHPLMFKIFNNRMERIYKEIVRDNGKVDIIHAQSSFWGGISAAYIAKKYNIPLIITEHSSIKRAVYLRESYKPFVKESYMEAKVLIAVGNGLKKELEEFTSREDVRVINNLIPLDIFKPKKVEVDDRFTFFSLAFLEGDKGMDLLIKAFASKFKNKDAILKIGGDGSQRQELEALAKELNIEDKVKFLGALTREEVATEMNLCSSFVLASKHETFGVVYIEALATGKPVIGTYNGGAEDIINKNNGILAKVNDVRSLEEALEKMYYDYKNYNSEDIRKACILKYSKDKIASEIIEVYNSR